MKTSSVILLSTRCRPDTFRLGCRVLQLLRVIDYHSLRTSALAADNASILLASARKRNPITKYIRVGRVGKITDRIWLRQMRSKVHSTMVGGNTTYN